MKWFQIIQKKLTAAIVLMVIFVILIITNYTEKKNANTMNEAAASIYKDRLVVESYILDYYRLLNNMREVMNKDSQKEQTAWLRSQIDILNYTHGMYKKTVLTESEKEMFKELEGNTVQISSLLKAKDYDGMIREIEHCFPVLNTLSSIQLSEAKLQMDKLDQLSVNSGIYSQLEMGILIVIALIIQGLIFTSKTFEPLRKAVGFSVN